jgi:hypothetical protein
MIDLCRISAGAAGEARACVDRVFVDKEMPPTERAQVLTLVKVSEERIVQCYFDFQKLVLQDFSRL